MDVNMICLSLFIPTSTTSMRFAARHLAGVTVSCHSPERSNVNNLSLNPFSSSSLVSSSLLSLLESDELLLTRLDDDAIGSGREQKN